MISMMISLIVKATPILHYVMRELNSATQLVPMHCPVLVIMKNLMINKL